MKNESKDPDTIDGAVRVAQLVNRSSFKEPWVFLSFLSFLSICWKGSYSVRFLRLAIILISSCIMFRTWLTLPDQSGLHRLELSVSHSTFALICNYTLFPSGDVVKCLHNTVCITYIVCGDLLCQSLLLLSTIWQCITMVSDETKNVYYVSSAIRWSSFLLFVLL